MKLADDVPEDGTGTKAINKHSDKQQLHSKLGSGSGLKKKGDNEKASAMSGGSWRKGPDAAKA